MKNVAQLPLADALIPAQQGKSNDFPVVGSMLGDHPGHDQPIEVNYPAQGVERPIGQFIDVLERRPRRFAHPWLLDLSNHVGFKSLSKQARHGGGEPTKTISTVSPKTVSQRTITTSRTAHRNQRPVG
jgi:hypothetical protein